MDIEYKYKMEVNRNSWFIKFYLWLWDAKPSQINICKLFWGYVFAVPAIVIRLLLIPLDKFFNWLEKRKTERILATPSILETPIKQPESKPKEEKLSRMQKILERIASFFIKVFQGIGWVIWQISRHKRLNRVLFHFVVGLAIVLGIAVIGAAFYFMVIGWQLTLKIAGSLVIGVGLLVLVIYLIEEGKLVWLGNLFKKFGRGTKKTGLGFFGMMRAGFIAVKSNTCPQVIVKN